MFSIDQFIPAELKSMVEGPRWEELKKTVLAVMLTQRLDVFNEERSSSGSWAKLKPSTMRGRESGHKILQDKGILRNSFSEGGGPGKEFREEIILDDLVALRTNVEYAAIHNHGGTVKHPGTMNGFGKGIEIPAHDIHIAARPFNEFSDEQIDEISEVIEVFLND